MPLYQFDSFEVVEGEMGTRGGKPWRCKIERTKDLGFVLVNVKHVVAIEACALHNYDHGVQAPAAYYKMRICLKNGKELSFTTSATCYNKYVGIECLLPEIY